MKPNSLSHEFHDACGIGFIAELSGIATRRTVELSIAALQSMSHRGASGAEDGCTCDGSGLLTDIPTDFFGMVLEKDLDKKVGRGEIGIGMVFTNESELPTLEKEFVTVSAALSSTTSRKRK